MKEATERREHRKKVLKENKKELLPDFTNNNYCIMENENKKEILPCDQIS